MDKWDPNWNNSGYASRDNYWAGAKKACDDIGMSLPDYSKLKSIYQAGQKDSSLGLPITDDYFWSSSDFYVSYAYTVSFGNGDRRGYGKYERKNNKVLCVGD